MWMTARGERTLCEYEWEVFRRGLRFLWDRIEDCLDGFDAYDTGVAVFDRLEPESKLAMMSLVGQALGDPCVPTPVATALSDGTIAAVYAAVPDIIAIEIMMERAGQTRERDRFSTRELVLAAVLQVFPDYGVPYPELVLLERVAGLRWKLPRPDSQQLDDWFGMVDELMFVAQGKAPAYDEENYYLDVDPGVSGRRKEEEHIDDEYFTTIAPDPNDRELELIRENLWRLCRGEADARE
jgi:hypothetical protein